MEQNTSRCEFDGKIKWIESLNSAEIDKILFAIISRYSILCPEDELICLFLPRNNIEERRQILQQVMEFLLKHPAEDKK